MTEYTLVLVAFGFLAVAVGIVAFQNSRLKRELEEHHHHFESIQQMFMVLGMKIHEMEKEKESTNA